MDTNIQEEQTVSISRVGECVKCWYPVPWYMVLYLRRPQLWFC